MGPEDETVTVRIINYDELEQLQPGSDYCDACDTREWYRRTGEIAHAKTLAHQQKSVELDDGNHAKGEPHPNALAELGKLLGNRASHEQPE